MKHDIKKLLEKKMITLHITPSLYKRLCEAADELSKHSEHRITRGYIIKEALLCWLETNNAEVSNDQISR
jgi:hypothetical protein